MAKCVRCSKKGLFLKISNNNLCMDCERIVKLEQEENQLKTTIENLILLQDKAEKSCKSMTEHRDKLYNEISEQAKNDINKKYEDVLNKTNESQKKCDELQEEYVKSVKTIETNANKLLRFKELIKSTQYSAKRYFENDEIKSELTKETISEEVDELLTTTIKLKLNLMDIRELRKRYNQNNKVIKDLLTKYQSRYTTKSNISIYKLMVIALEAELQNILYNLKYSKLDKAIKDIKLMTAKYQKIAIDGNQNIAPTVSKFIGEIEYLYIEAIKIEYEYYIQKERIKEEQKELRAKMIQEAKERKQLEEERKKVEREETKFKNEIEDIERQIAETKDANIIKQLEDRKSKRLNELQNLEMKKEEILKRELGIAGVVYIVSNLGSFGDSVFKIGMTRRTDPETRIDELGGASVPFKFDIHSIIFSQNVPELETKLHKQLHNKRVNKINLRKEFFKISIDELEELVYSIEPTAEFNKTMLAEQYYQSMAVDEIPESVQIVDENDFDDDSDDTE